MVMRFYKGIMVDALRRTGASSWVESCFHHWCWSSDFTHCLLEQWFIKSQNLSVAFIILIRTEQRSRMFSLCTHSECLVCGIHNALYTTFILVMTFWQTFEYECDRECVWIRACCWLENEESAGLLVFVFCNCLLQDLTFGYLTQCHAPQQTNFMPQSPLSHLHQCKAFSAWAHNVLIPWLEWSAAESHQNPVVIILSICDSRCSLLAMDQH